MKKVNINNLISLRLISADQKINCTIFVDPKISSANLMTLMGEEIKKIDPDFSPEKYRFIRNGAPLVFNARSLTSQNFKDGDSILVCEIEEDHIIEYSVVLSDNSIGELIAINLVSHDHSFFFKLEVNDNMTSTELINFLTNQILEKYPNKSNNEFYFIYNEKKLNLSSQTLDDLGIKDGDTFLAFEIKPLLDENLDLEVSVIIDESNKHEINVDFKLKGLLKFCLIKDMSLIIDKDIDYYQEKINKKVKHILEIISGGNIDLNQTENSIMSVLKKFEGINILNFSKFIDNFISNEELREIFKILKEEDKATIQKENDCLSSYSEYIKKFEEDFEKSRKQSVFEWRITSMTIVDRKDLKTFEESKNNCPNRIDRILFHGTGIIPSSKILTDMFHKSEKSGYQFGKGVYFTDFLDYAWYYGGNVKKVLKDKNGKTIEIEPNRVNLNNIPKIGERFVLIGTYIYYNKNGLRRVYDHKYNPAKNEINFALANSETETIHTEKPDKSKFYGTEYVINELNQICPFLGCSLKRDEFCVIWRDSNFSPNPVYNDEFDEIFKKFLKKEWNIFKKK